jgi:hypothetical protein
VSTNVFWIDRPEKVFGPAAAPSGRLYPEGAGLLIVFAIVCWLLKVKLKEVLLLKPSVPPPPAFPTACISEG